MSAPFTVPSTFIGDPTKAPFPRQLIIYDERSHTWSATVDKKMIARTKYLCISYRQSDFPDSRQLEQIVQNACLESKHCDDLRAYWIDYACTGESQEEKNMDLYRIADVFRGAAKTLIMIKGIDDTVHSLGWLSWGNRLWTLPEALLSGYRGDKLLYKAGTRPIKSITLREIANHAYESGDKEMSLMNVYSGEPVIASQNMFETLVKAIWNRSSDTGEGMAKGAFTAYDAERVYVLMGFMPRRIRPDPHMSEKDAFKDLMKENSFDKDLDTILDSSGDETSPAASRIQSVDAEQMRILDKVHYTGEMSFRTERCCLENTRCGILEEIKGCINNADGMFEDKRVFLLSGVAGSGKSSIAHSIASHYNSVGRLGSSFFFSETFKQNSVAVNLLRTIVRDLAFKNAQYKINLCNILKDDPSLCTTPSIHRQFEYFLEKALKGVTILEPIVIVIDALDECERVGDERRTLLCILAKRLSALPINIRLFLTARAGDTELFRIFDSSQYVKTFFMNEIDPRSKRDDIQTFLWHNLSPMNSELTHTYSNWLDKHCINRRNPSFVTRHWSAKLAQMAGNLFIWASTACNYILKDDGRSPGDRLRTLLSFEDDIDSDSPTGVVYKLYAEVLNSTFKTRERKGKSLEQAQEGFRKVMGMVQVACIPLTVDEMDEFFGANLVQSESTARPIINQMGTLLEGAGDSNIPVQLLHASFGDFLRDKALSGNFHVEVQFQHGKMAKYCLDVMNRDLKFNIFKFNNVFASHNHFGDASPLRLWRSEGHSVPYSDIDEEDLEIRRQSISKILRYACQYWPSHVTQMRSNDYGLIEEPLERFLFGEKHLMQWIEVISVIDQTNETCDALLALYKWFKEVMNINERTVKLAWECYHLFRSFSEPIASGPLQVYVSALPYVPSETLLHIHYRSFSILHPDILLGNFQDIRILSPTFPVYFLVTAVAFSRDGTRIAALSESKVEVFSFATFSPIGDPIELNYQYKTIVFSPDGFKIAVIGAEKYAVWNLTEYSAVIQESNVGGEIIDVAFLTNDRLLCCIRRHTVEGIELQDKDLLVGQVKCRFRVRGRIVCAAMSPNARYMGCISRSNRVSAWDVTNRNIVTNNAYLGDPEDVESEDVFNVMCISCDGVSIACGSDWGTIKLWNSQTASCVWTGKLDSDLAIKQILIPLSPDSKCLVTVTDYDNMHLWDMASGSCYEHESSFLSENGVSAISPDGMYLVTSLGRECRVWMIERNNGELGTNKAVLLPGDELVEVMFLQDGSVLAWGRGVKERDLIIWDNLGTKNAFRQILREHSSHVYEVKFSRDGRRLISRGYKEVFLWYREGNDVRFKLQEKRECNHWNVSHRLFASLTHSWKTDFNPESPHGTILESKDHDNTHFGQANRTDGIFGFRDRWVPVRLMNGETLCYIPDIFSGWHEIAQKGCKIVVYGQRFAICLEYEDDAVRAILSSG